MKTDSKIRVLHIIKSLGRGGAEMLLPETLRLHNQVDFEFHYIYFLPWKDQMVSSIESCGGKVTCLPARNNVQLLLRLRDVIRYIKKHNIDVVHAHLPWAGIVARLAGLFARVPVLYTEHNKQERYHFATRWMNLATMNMLTKVIAVSDDVAGSIRKNKRSLSVPVHTILNGVNTNRFLPAFGGGDDIKKQLNIPAGARVVGTIAVFRFQKRLKVWLEIAHAILRSTPDVHFVIVGDGPLRDELMATRAQLGLHGKVHVVGLQTEVRPYLAAFDVYMMTSVFEGLPIALLEAMASGCAIATTDAGGIKELIEHEKSGLMCPVEEPHTLVTYVNELLTNEAKRQQVGGEARQRVVEKFSMQKMVAQLEWVYSDTVRSLSVKK